MWIDQYQSWLTGQGQGRGREWKPCGDWADQGLIVWAAAVFDGSVATEAIIDTLMSIMQSIMDSNAINNIHGRNPIREVVLARFKTACCV